MIQHLAPRFVGSLALAAVMLAPAAPVLAQDMPAVLPNDYLITDIPDAQGVDAATDSGREATLTASLPSGGEAPVRSATAYRPSPEISARVERQFAEWMAVLAGTEGGRRVAVALADRDPVRSWAKIVGSDGLAPGDMADALTSYWILNWVMANRGDSGAAEAQAVRRQVRQLIAANSDLSQLDEAGRQELSEVLMLNYLIQHAAYTDALARGDRAAVRRLGEAAVARFQSDMGVDLRELSLTETGFSGDRAWQ